VLHLVRANARFGIDFRLARPRVLDHLCAADTAFVFSVSVVSAFLPYSKLFALHGHRVGQMHMQ
jgi:hypothetical protein